MIIDWYAFVNAAKYRLGISRSKMLHRQANKNARRRGRRMLRTPRVAGDRTGAAQDTAKRAHQYADFDS